jgi:predicted RNA-binding protein with PIN domain
VTHTLVVDGANVVGSRPDGWWKDRAGAARRLHEALLVADTPYDAIVLVLEGAAKAGVRAGRDGHLRTVHATGNGDDSIVAEARTAAGEGHRVSVVTADRALQARVQAVGAVALGPSWLLDQLR